MSNQQYVQAIEVEGLHKTGTYPGKGFDLEFGPGVNVVYGLNGSGKTTLLHMIANVLNRDLRKFGHLEFDRITVRITDGRRTEAITLWTEVDGRRVCLLPDSSEPIVVLSAEEVSWMERRRTHRGRHSSQHEMRPRAQASYGTYTTHVGHGGETRTRHQRRRMRASHHEPSAHHEETESRLQEELDGIELPKVSYFPAFRNVSEVIQLIERDEIQHDPTFRNISEEVYSRAFGDFAPVFEYPSFLEIEDNLQEKVEQIVSDVGRQNREVLSEMSYRALKTSLPNLSDATEGLRSVVAALQETPIYAWLPEVARTYQELFEGDASDVGESLEIAQLYSMALSQIVEEQRDRYEDIRRFKDDAVNKFLNDKELVIRPMDDPRRGTEVGIRRSGSDELIELGTMSSGERQVFSLLYAASFLGENEMVLIDEPEISLHIDWQTQLAEAMSNILGSKQLVVCTHSPEIFAGFRKAKGACTIELDPAPIQQQDYEEVLRV